MKERTKIILFVIFALIAGVLLGKIIFNNEDLSNVKSERSQLNSEDVWTCSMHPQIRQSEPGDCPLCGMDLILLQEEELNGMSSIKMSPTAMQLADVRTSIITNEVPNKKISLNGIVKIDERRVSSQTVEIDGRIEQLFVHFDGEKVRKGDLIAEIYSSELLLAHKELLEAFKQNNKFPELYMSARNKFINWKFSSQQIDEFVEMGDLLESFPIFSEYSGVLMNKTIEVGDHLRKGEILFEVSDLSHLWIEFDLYEDEIQFVKLGNEIVYEFNSYPGISFSGYVDFIDPVVEEITRVTKARLSMKNVKGDIKPGMFVHGEVSSTLETKSSSLIIPKTALLWTGNRSLVYVKYRDDKDVLFQMREIVVGQSLGEHYSVLSGLSIGEEIVTYGVFSVDAAAQLAGKKSMMNPGDEDVSEDVLNVMSEMEVCLFIENFMIPYLELKDRLVNDDFNNLSLDILQMKNGLSKFITEYGWSENSQEIMKLLLSIENDLNSMANAEQINGVRSYFDDLSSKIFMLLDSCEINGTYYLQYCPMANNDKGAVWLSKDKYVLNPYFGSKMLKCGMVKNVIN